MPAILENDKLIFLDFMLMMHSFRYSGPIGFHRFSLDQENLTRHESCYKLEGHWTVILFELILVSPVEGHLQKLDTKFTVQKTPRRYKVQGVCASSSAKNWTITKIGPTPKPHVVELMNRSSLAHFKSNAACNTD